MKFQNIAKKKHFHRKNSNFILFSNLIVLNYWLFRVKKQITENIIIIHKDTLQI